MQLVKLFIFLILIEAYLIICSYPTDIAVVWWSKLLVCQPIVFKIKKREERKQNKTKHDQ